MFDILIPYKNNGHFFLGPHEALEKVCNAPKTKYGVFIVYELKNGRVKLVYIGSSGKIQNNGKIKDPLRGLYGRIANGEQFGQPRKKSWAQKLLDENIDALDIYWYDTEKNEMPTLIKALLLHQHFSLNGELPRWNKEF